jgi:4-amino-4-deoxy-L-arabinose transferase-like glycosyltransferase
MESTVQYVTDAKPQEPLQIEKRFSRLIFALLVTTLALTSFFPLLQDEAYYLSWAKRSTWPVLGFFDHPPFVSWQAGIFRMIDDFRTARLMVWVTMMLALYVQLQIVKELGGKRQSLFISAIIGLGSLGGMANSFLLTPDSGLHFFWCLSLWLAVLAIRRDPRYWLLAGFSAGMGFYAKYTVLFLGPVFLLGLFFEKGRQLRTRWPYLGVILAFLVMTPHLIWNSQNDWVSLKFQLGHGFSTKSSLSIGSSLPKAEGSTHGSSTMILYNEMQRSMSGVSGFEETLPKIRPQKTLFDEARRNIENYAGGIAGLWGLFAVFFLVKIILTLKSKYLQKQNNDISQRISDILSIPGARLLGCSVAFPLVFFGLLSPFSKIEANWPALHMPALIVLLAVANIASLTKNLAWIILGHIAIVIGVANMTHLADFLPNLRSNRVIVESQGYDELVQFVRRHIGSPRLLAVDSYQLKSAIAYRDLTIRTAQWPGITRPSEYTRGHPDDTIVERELLQSKDFYLLTSESIPPELPGTDAIALQGIRACPNGLIAFYDKDYPILPCAKGIKDWSLVKYQRRAP